MSPLALVPGGVFPLALLLSAKFRRVLMLRRTHRLDRFGIVRFPENSAKTLIAIQECSALSSKRVSQHNVV
jgi:hypothetical protein